MVSRPAVTPSGLHDLIIFIVKSASEPLRARIDILAAMCGGGRPGAGFSTRSKLTLGSLSLGLSTLSESDARFSF